MLKVRFLLLLLLLLKIIVVLVLVLVRIQHCKYVHRTYPTSTVCINIYIKKTMPFSVVQIASWQIQQNQQQQRQHTLRRSFKKMMGFVSAAQKKNESKSVSIFFSSLYARWPCLNLLFWKSTLLNSFDFILFYARLTKYIRFFTLLFIVFFSLLLILLCGSSINCISTRILSHNENPYVHYIYIHIIRTCNIFTTSKFMLHSKTQQQ